MYDKSLAANEFAYISWFTWPGNIRVYCRIRPFLSGQNRKQTTIQYIGENGELVVINPSKPGKESHRLFKFNKVFAPAVTQGSNFTEILTNIYLDVLVSLSLVLITPPPLYILNIHLFIYLHFYDFICFLKLCFLACRGGIPGYSTINQICP